MLVNASDESVRGRLRGEVWLDVERMNSRERWDGEVTADVRHSFAPLREFFTAGSDHPPALSTGANGVNGSSSRRACFGRQSNLTLPASIGRTRTFLLLQIPQPNHPLLTPLRSPPARPAISSTLFHFIFTRDRLPGERRAKGLELTTIQGMGVSVTRARYSDATHINTPRLPIEPPFVLL